MLVHRTNFFKRCCLAVTAVTFGGAVALAQEDTEQPADDDEVIEELVVYAKEKSGDPVDVDALYEEMMRERLMLDQDRMQVLEEENEWRSSGSTTLEESSRIQWGYSPQDERRMQRELDLSDMQEETVRPATLFRVGF
jgi:hypothetical protein